MGNCKHTTPCGCGDQPLPSLAPCNQTGPCAGEPCAELFCEECIVHCQPDMSVAIPGGPIVITITQGMRWDEIIQTLMTALATPACLGESVVGLKVLGKTSDTITIKWVGTAGVNYTIQWQEGINIHTVVVHDVYQYQIINLIPDTTYTIKIITENGPCESVVLTVKTLAA